ncbi:hypothetical protein J2Z83_001680 [Virgibacillus natechei]|uniref:DUF1798 family protein n=1 Tax=Virgibacillus natechei TaxID=1216297 RepID=A0ABS4IF58_9BACI|nr:DUF1798 family protein [Virgibacillus natechei]MBP1969573.1 hypothetical protein [Virgibacillus natechei]UZD14801.1 YppE family protein [Virgibacillus natechei]
MDLKNQTVELKQHLNRLKDKYENDEPPENKKDRQFFLKVKEESTPIYELLAKWEEDSLQIVKERKINVHPQQITSTRENMELLLMHSFYIDVKRKRFMELNNSIAYIFDQLLREMN